MNRRDALKAIGGGGAAVAIAPALLTAAIIAKPKREPLPRLRNGDVFTAEAWCAVVDRINELEQQ